MQVRGSGTSAGTGQLRGCSPAAVRRGCTQQSLWSSESLPDSLVAHMPLPKKHRETHLYLQCALRKPSSDLPHLVERVLVLQEGMSLSPQAAEPRSRLPSVDSWMFSVTTGALGLCKSVGQREGDAGIRCQDPCLQAIVECIL